ncbi:MAG: nucleotidyl transferase AbiEii/AbiGii toxin family protein [Micavibrio aeruginosavorus]|uniref:Nucleotidyl transferase AbiEii/AbiGii toxin family protein n=1 Tax=Micavibrio aeruginosavorus TaxID=349221 RepID=A0A2W5C167_9BACT|nr:MAG: nucleotidyl transferase AbiEii/AbiGii toxin family protein [Micavibrio aeruginosavorus]
MDKFATRPDQERRDILQEAASRRDLADIIIEKDFWVCWTLKRLFSNPNLAPYLTFKGGTSLSKAYGLIERFSEDIDLTISHNAPFLADGREPMEEDISGKERERRIDALKENAQLFVERVALPELYKNIENLLGNEGWSIGLDAEDPERQTILFHYPKVFSYGGYGSGMYGSGLYGVSPPASYIRPQIKLEFGARGEIEPNETRTIMPYATETFPDIFPDPSSNVSVLGADRTFWEKATILHALHHGSKMRDRMSRHYYDTYMLDQKGIADAALRNSALLERVVRNKSLLFKDAKASYGTATLGSLKLIPSQEQQKSLKDDYDKMAEMFMGGFPAWEAIINGLTELEARINRA